MPRSKTRKKKSQTNPPPSPPPPQIRASLLKRFSKWLFASWWHQVEFGVSLVVGCAAIGGWIYDALREPEIHPSTARLEKPFLLPFSFRNPSWFFAINEATFLCVIYDVTLANGGGARSLSVTQGNKPASIGPMTTRQYTCPYDRVLGGLPGGPIVKADVAIQTSFTTFGFHRVATSDHFTWNASTGQWTEGAPLN